jgi:hypothetical protein
MIEKLNYCIFSNYSLSGGWFATRGLNPKVHPIDEPNTNQRLTETGPGGLGFKPLKTCSGLVKSLFY